MKAFLAVSLAMFLTAQVSAQTDRAWYSYLPPNEQNVVSSALRRITNYETLVASLRESIGIHIDAMLDRRTELTRMIDRRENFSMTDGETTADLLAQWKELGLELESYLRGEGGFDEPSLGDLRDAEQRVRDEYHRILEVVAGSLPEPDTDAFGASISFVRAYHARRGASVERIMEFSDDIVARVRDVESIEALSRFVRAVSDDVDPSVLRNVATARFFATRSVQTWSLQILLGAGDSVIAAGLEKIADDVRHIDEDLSARALRLARDRRELLDRVERARASVIPFIRRADLVFWMTAPRTQPRLWVEVREFAAGLYALGREGTTVMYATDVAFRAAVRLYVAYYSRLTHRQRWNLAEASGIGWDVLDASWNTAKSVLHRRVDTELSESLERRINDVRETIESSAMTPAEYRAAGTQAIDEFIRFVTTNPYSRDEQFLWAALTVLSNRYAVALLAGDPKYQDIALSLEQHLDVMFDRIELRVLEAITGGAYVPRTVEDAYAYEPIFEQISGTTRFERVSTIYLRVEPERGAPIRIETPRPGVATLFYFGYLEETNPMQAAASGTDGVRNWASIHGVTVATAAPPGVLTGRIAVEDIDDLLRSVANGIEFDDSDPLRRFETALRGWTNVRDIGTGLLNGFAGDVAFDNRTVFGKRVQLTDRIVDEVAAFRISAHEAVAAIHRVWDVENGSTREAVTRYLDAFIDDLVRYERTVKAETFHARSRELLRVVEGVTRYDEATVGTLFERIEIAASTGELDPATVEVIRARVRDLASTIVTEDE